MLTDYRTWWYLQYRRRRGCASVVLVCWMKAGARSVGGLVPCAGGRTILGLVAAAVVVLVFTLHTSSPASADHTELFFSTSNTTPTRTGLLLLLPGEPVDVHVWAHNVDDPEGMAAFDLGVSVDPQLLSIDSMLLGPFLGSTGRTVFCLPMLSPGPDGPQARLSCNTVGRSPPNGPQGSGVLATLALRPKLALGRSALTLSDALLLDVSPNAQFIPAASIPSQMI